MDIKKLIKKKYRLKYFTLVVILLLYVPLIGIITTQFVYESYFKYFFIAFIALFIFVIILNTIYEKKYSLPQIDSLSTLQEYLNYFAIGEFKYLEYTESITWFYRLIHTSYLEKKTCSNDYDQIVNQLHYILRPSSRSKTCSAIKYPKSFASLASKIIGEINTSSDFSESIFTSNAIFSADNEEKHFVINWLHDKNILIYMSIFPIHTLGCFLLSLNPSFSKSIFVGNLCLYIPADIIAILLYNGIIRNSK